MFTGAEGFSKPMNDRNETIRRIKTALHRRSGKAWSVTGGRGTAWGWITIDAPPARRTWGHRMKAGAVANTPDNYEEYDTGSPGGYASPTERAELAKFLGFDRPVHCQGVSIASSSDHYNEYTQRAETGSTSLVAQPYWD